MYNHTILLAIEAGSGNSNYIYFLIVLAGVAASVLMIIQLIRYFGFDHEDLNSDIKVFVTDSQCSDEKTLADYVDDYFLHHLLQFDEIIKTLISSLTIIGLLGTFIGLARHVVPEMVRLSGLENQWSVLKESLGNMAGGFNTAFETSIYGIVGALVLSVLYNILRQMVKNKRRHFVHFYLPAIMLQTKKDSLPYDPVQFYNEIQNFFLDGLNKFAEQNDKSHGRLKEWAQSVVTSNTKMVTFYVETNNNKMSQVLVELQKEYSSLQNVSKNNLAVSKILNSLIDKLDAFSDVIRNYDQTYEKLLTQIDEFSQRFGNLFSQMNTMVDVGTKPSQLLSNLYSSIGAMVNNQNLILSDNREILESAQKQFETLLGQSAVQSSKSASDIKQVFDSFLETMQLAMSEEKMKEMISPAIQSLETNLSPLKLTMVELSKHALEAQEQMNEIISVIKTNRADAEFMESIKQSSSQLAANMDKINRNLGKVLTSIGD